LSNFKFIKLYHLSLIIRALGHLSSRRLQGGCRVGFQALSWLFCNHLGPTSERFWRVSSSLELSRPEQIRDPMI
jgi:hypothetical protein